MKTKTQLSDFTFRPSGHGYYGVTYTSPVTGKEWKTMTSNMQLIDDTRNADYPLRKDLNYLKEVCKGIYTKFPMIEKIRQMRF